MSLLQAAERPRAADERRVLHAHLRPATPDGAWALRWALEDALRCASFDDVGRLVLVRRLRIGALPPRCASAQLSAAIERAWREAARSAVPALSAGDPGLAHEAVDATVVWFTSPAAAQLAALARVIDGATLAGWFWPRAVPMLAAPGGRGERVVALLDDVVAAAPAAAAQALSRWPQARLDTLRGLLALQAPGRRECLNVPTSQASSPAVATAAGSQRRDDAPNGSRPRFLPLDRAVGAAPFCHPPPAAPDSPGPLPIGRATASDLQRGLTAPIAARAAAAPSVPVHAPLPPRPPSAASSRASRAAVTPLAAATEAPSFDARSAAPGAAGAAPGVEGMAPARASQPSVAPITVSTPQRGRPSAPLRWPWLHDARLSAHGGILWLLNLLPALGFGPGMPPALVRAVLGGLMDRAGLPADDPQREVLPPAPDAAAPRARDPEARRWQAHARRVLRRRAGLSLVDLACRPGWVTVTPTHADLVLPMSATDLRVRRLGLDRDPGWVPWLGRIVSFHFVAREDWPDAEMPDG